jgi:hypothetical protein
MSMSEKKMLLVTTTGEPYQPVRLKWSVPSKAYCLQRLKGLACVGLDAETKLLSLWKIAEAERLALGTSHGLKGAAPSSAPGRHVVLGTFRFPDEKSMVLEVRSFARATETARLLRPVLGASARLTRARVVNRWFAASELADGLPALGKWLDRNVTITRSEEEVADELDALVARGKTPEERQVLLLRWHEARRKVDVPLVEDFPCHPEDEDEQMGHLSTTLNFRFVRASRHWAGEQVTLAEVIEEIVANPFPASGPLPRCIRSTTTVG